MKREIKFRGYNLKNKKWLYGYYLVNRGKHYIVKDEIVNPFVEESDFEVDPESVGQKIGELDGVELYEGDVVNMKRVDKLLHHGMIMWDDTFCDYAIRGNDGYRMIISLANDLFRYEVIGNEYEKNR